MICFTSLRFSTRPWSVYGFARLIILVFGVFEITAAVGAIEYNLILVDEFDGCNNCWWWRWGKRRVFVGVACQFRADPNGFCCWRLLSKREDDVDEILIGVPYPFPKWPFLLANTEPFFIFVCSLLIFCFFLFFL